MYRHSPSPSPKDFITPREEFFRPSPSPSPSESDESPTPYDTLEQSPSYCHGLSLPLYLNRQPSEPHILRICLHPEWKPLPNGVIHLINDEAFISRTCLHDAPLAQVDYKPVDLWSVYTTLEDEQDVQAPYFIDMVPASESRGCTCTCHHSDPWASRYSFLWTILFLLAAIAMAVYPGHPAWINTSWTSDWTPFNIWQPITAWYSEYGRVLLPLKVPILFNQSMPFPSRPDNIVATLAEEMEVIYRSVNLWQSHINDSDLILPQIDTSLVKNMAIYTKELDGVFDILREVDRSSVSALSSGAAKILAWQLYSSHEKFDMIQHIRTFWKVVGERNRELLEALLRLNNSLAVLGGFDAIIDPIEQNLVPYADDRLWIEDTLDAITFTRRWLAGPIQHVIPMAVSRALKGCSVQESMAALQLMHWEEMVLSGGITREMKCPLQSDAWLTSWLVKCKFVTTRRYVDGTTTSELKFLSEGMDRVGVQVDDTNEDWRPWVYRHKRPSEARV